MVFIHLSSSLIGFLSTQDGVTDDNVGMKDQILAMKWVQKNIHNFGGDPNQVTIMGQSGGAVCITYHMLNRKSAGKTITVFFKRLSHNTLKNYNTSEKVSIHRVFLFLFKYHLLTEVANHQCYLYCICYCSKQVY